MINWLFKTWFSLFSGDDYFFAIPILHRILICVVRQWMMNGESNYIPSVGQSTLQYQCLSLEDVMTTAGKAFSVGCHSWNAFFRAWTWNYRLAWESHIRYALSTCKIPIMLVLYEKFLIQLHFKMTFLLVQYRRKRPATLWNGWLDYSDR